MILYFGEGPPEHRKHVKWDLVFSVFGNINIYIKIIMLEKHESIFTCVIGLRASTFVHLWHVSTKVSLVHPKRVHHICGPILEIQAILIQ